MQDGDRAPDHLGGAVAVKALGARVPAHHGAVQCLADDRVVAGLDDGGQVGGNGLGLPAVPPFLRGVQLALYRGHQSGQVVLHHVVVRAGLHHFRDGLLSHHARRR